MRTYDILAVFSPEQTAEQVTALTDAYRKILVDAGGKVVLEEPWGRRKLAYTIDKKREGIYHLWTVEATPEAVAEVERRMRLADEVLRHLAVRTDEEVRRSVKLTKIREAKAARRPKRVVEPGAAPAAPAEQ